MSGVDPFSLTPQASDSCLSSTLRHDGEQTVRAEVHREFGFNSPNGRDESVVRENMGSRQLNERPELRASSEQLTVQPELSVVNEQGQRQVDISPPAGEQRGSFVSESCDLAGGEVSNNALASQMELAECCRDEDCPLRTVKPAMGTPGRLVTDIEGNDFSCRSYGSDAGIARSPMSEKSFTGDFSMINYPAVRVDDDTDDMDDDDMQITRADLYPDSYGRGSQVAVRGSGWGSTDMYDGAVYTQGLCERPNRAIRRPARYEDYETQYAPTQSYKIGSIRYVRAIQRCECSTGGRWLTPTQFIRGASRYVFSRGVG